MEDIRYAWDPLFNPIKQKERRYTQTGTKPFDKKSIGYLTFGFIRPVHYPSWLANPVIVKKPDGSWHMCIAYTSLNKGCPKDE
jgi:hypothetical protein